METVEVTQADIERVVAERLASSPAMYLATADGTTPWVGGAFFAEDGLYTLELVLERHGRTLTALRSNPVAAVVVASGTPFEPFVQGQVDAVVLDGDEAVAARQRLIAKVPQAAGFMDAPIETVRLTVRAWRATDVLGGWLPGKTVTNPAMAEPGR